MCLFGLIDLKFLDWQMCFISGTDSDPSVVSVWSTVSGRVLRLSGEKCCDQLISSVMGPG